MKAELGYLAAGAALGIAAAALLTPKSGAQTRKYLRSKANEGTDYLVRRGEEAQNQVMTAIERGKEMARDQMDHFGAAIEAGRRAYVHASRRT